MATLKLKGKNGPTSGVDIPKNTCLAGEATISQDIFPVDVMEIFHLKMLVFMKRIRIQCVFFFSLSHLSYPKDHWTLKTGNF